MPLTSQYGLSPVDVKHVRIATQYYAGSPEPIDYDRNASVDGLSVQHVRECVQKYLGDLNSAPDNHKGLLSRQVGEVVSLNVKLYPNSTPAQQAALNAASKNRPHYGKVIGAAA